MSQQLEHFVLVNLYSEGAIKFRYFPRAISLDGRSNWESQNVTIGAKPLFYANREPQRVRIDEVWLDKTTENESIGPEIIELMQLQEETERGTPPLLLAQYGEVNLVCVLEDVRIEQTFFSPSGSPLRARVQMTLVEVQEDDASDARQQPPQPTTTTLTPTGRRTVEP